MTETKSYTNLQLATLVFLRLLIGWHLLYEGISKLLNPGWSSIGFLRESQWIMSGFAKWIASNSSVLSTVDFLNTWGLLRALTSTMIGGRIVNVTHLHLKEWIDCIRNGGTPSDDIEKAFEEGITVLMAHKSYLEKRRVEWDPVLGKIV